jgi:hypothetical protein
MALEYSIEHEQELIKVTVRGKFDYLSMDQMWKDISAACKKNNCSSILGIANIEAPTTYDAYDHAAILDAIDVSPNLHIAWVENNPAATEMAKLAEAVIRNRDLATGRVFGSTFKARRWLAEVANTP